MAYANSKIRINGIRKDYKFLKWLEANLQKTPSSIDCFSFAEQFEGTEEATNTNYKDLLLTLQSHQSNKLTNIAHNAEMAFNVYAYYMLNLLTTINLILLYHRADEIEIQLLEVNIQITGRSAETKF